MSSRRTRCRRKRAFNKPVVEKPQFDQKRDEPQGTKPEEQNLSASPPHKVKPETVAVPSLKNCVLQEVSVEGMDYSDFFDSLSLDSLSDGRMEEESSDDEPDAYKKLLGIMLDPPGLGARSLVIKKRREEKKMKEKMNKVY